MDLGSSRWGETQRVFGNSENICFEKTEIKKWPKSVNLCHIRRVVRGVGNKKPQLITVGVSYLVEAAGIEPASANPLPKDLHV